MKKRITKTLSAVLVIALLLGAFMCFPATAAEENAPVIVKSDFYDNVKKVGNDLPVSDLENYVSDGIKGGFGTPYTPTVYRESRYTVYRVYVEIGEGKTASDYSFRILSGLVDTSGAVPVSKDSYITRAYVKGSDDAIVAITEEVVDGVSCVVCTYTLNYRQALDFDSLTEAETDGTVDINQISRIFCEVTDITAKKTSTTVNNAFYISEKHGKGSVRDLNTFIKENYNLELLTPEVYYKNNEGVYTSEADGAVRLPGDEIELALSIPDLDAVPHITGMTAQAMNSNYSKFVANSPEMRLEWYGANMNRQGDGYVEEYLGSGTYAMHELFHEWYYEWQDSGVYILGTDTVSALHPETTYSISDDLVINYEYVYCKMVILIKTGAVSGSFAVTTDYFAIPGFTEEEAPVVLKGDVNDDTRVNARDTLALKRFNSDSTRVINKENYDMNGDGRINSRDAISLKKYLAG